MESKYVQLEIMDSALAAASQCSTALERLLQQAKENGRPGLDLVEHIVATNKECHKQMKNYIAAYEKYYSADVA